MMQVFTSDTHENHAAAPQDSLAVSQNFECPERVRIIRREFAQRQLGVFTAPQQYGMSPILRVHDAGYVDFVRDAYARWRSAGHSGEALAPCPDTQRSATMHSVLSADETVPSEFDEQLIYYTLTNETSIGAHSYVAAVEAVDIALSATHNVLSGANVAFGLCRPPGHHAPQDQFGGFCYFNNVAIAARAAVDAGVSRVAVLDIDYHHGNGTQSILQDDPHIFFASLHADTRYAYPFILGHATQIGIGAGEGTMRNFPMPAYTADDVWSPALQQAVGCIQDFGAELLLVSLGVDTFEGDPIANFRLKSPDYLRYGALIARLRLPTVYIMEGGYNLDFIGINVANVLQGHVDHMR